MPEGLVNALADRDLASLVRFLSELGRTADYSLPRQRSLRTWGVLEATGPARHLLRRTRHATAVEDHAEFRWQARYSRVDGGLPLDELPVVVPVNRNQAAGVAFVRTVVNVETAGELGLQLDGVEGLQLYANGDPVPVQDRLAIAVEPGAVRLTLIVNTAERSSSLNVIIDEATTTAVVAPVND